MLIIAIAFQIVLVLYHQVTTLVDLFPFNGVRFNSLRERFFEAGFNLVLMGVPPVGFIFRISLLMRFGVAYYFILLAAEFATWWVPYFFGASPKWVEIYSRVQGRTITPIPRRGNNPAPNLEHLILMALTIVTAVVTLIAYRAVTGVAFQGWLGTAVVGVLVVGGVIYQCCLQGRKR